MPGVIAAFFESDAGRILTPEIGLSPHLESVTLQELAGLGARLGVPAARTAESWFAAVAHQGTFQQSYREAIEDALPGVNDPAVILAGRPYAAYAPEVNLSVPRKIATRGCTVIPGDAVSSESPLNERNVWHYTQDLMWRGLPPGTIFSARATGLAP